MTWYALTKRGTLHKVIKTETGELMSIEADNLDDAETTVYGRIFDVPEQAIKRFCKRCFPGGTRE